VPFQPLDGFPNLLSGRRWAVAAALVLGVITLHELGPGHLEHDPSFPSPPHLVFWLELPLAMFALSTAYRWSLRRRLGSLPTLVSTLAVSMLLAIFVTCLTAWILSRFAEFRSPLVSRHNPLVVGSVLGVIQCGIWALAFVYPYAAEESRIRALEAERLRSGAELARLRSQLEPHFLRNTLNAIAGLVTQNPREARRLLASLGELLSDALRDANELQTVQDEVAWLRRYADILEARYAGVLTFRWDIDPELASALIPRLLLQPLVENAVKHGALSRDSEGEVAIRIQRASAPCGDRLLCSIEDNGAGTGDSAPRSEAFGLRAVRRRLELKYEDASFSLQSSETGTRAIVELPLSFASEAYKDPA
jgi:signal transduction histidine kinase